MALQSSFAVIRNSVLRHLRVPVNFNCQQCAAPTLTAMITRGFAGGVYLDKTEVTDRIMHVTKHFNKVDQAKVKASAHFEKDLGLDSLDVVELVMAFEEEFAIEIPDADADKIFTVEDAVNYVSQHPQAK